KDAALRGELEPDQVSNKLRTMAAKGREASGEYMRSRAPSVRCSATSRPPPTWGGVGGGGTSPKPGAVGIGATVVPWRLALCCLRSFPLIARAGPRARPRGARSTPRLDPRGDRDYVRGEESGSDARAQTGRRVGRVGARRVTGCPSSSWPPKSSGSVNKDDCRPLKIEIHADWSEA